MEKPEKFRTSGGNWSFVSGNVPLMNESMDEMINKMNDILKSDMKSSEAMILTVMNPILAIA